MGDAVGVDLGDLAEEVGVFGWVVEAGWWEEGHCGSSNADRQKLILSRAR